MKALSQLSILYLRCKKTKNISSPNIFLINYTIIDGFNETSDPVFFILYLVYTNNCNDILDKVTVLILMFIAYDLYSIPHALSFTAFAVFFGLRKGKRSNI